MQPNSPTARIPHILSDRPECLMSTCPMPPASAAAIPVTTDVPSLAISTTSITSPFRKPVRAVSAMGRSAASRSVPSRCYKGQSVGVGIGVGSSLHAATSRLACDGQEHEHAIEAEAAHGRVLEADGWQALKYTHDALRWFPRTLYLPHAPVAQWIEHRPPEPVAGVRVSPGVPPSAPTTPEPHEVLP